MGLHKPKRFCTRTAVKTASPLNYISSPGRVSILFCFDLKEAQSVFPEHHCELGPLLVIVRLVSVSCYNQCSPGFRPTVQETNNEGKAIHAVPAGCVVLGTEVGTRHTRYMLLPNLYTDVFFPAPKFPVLSLGCTIVIQKQAKLVTS